MSVNRCAFRFAGNATVTTTCQGGVRPPRIRRQRPLTPLPDRTDTLEATDTLEVTDPLEGTVPQKKPRSGARLKGLLGVVISLAIAAIAIYALTHALKKVDYGEVIAVVHRTNSGLIALALMLVVISYGSLTIYDLLALRTIGRNDVPYRIAALASFTSYPIAHGIGAVALISPVIRYRGYSVSGLGAVHGANICFFTGLTFWLGNLTAFAGGDPRPLECHRSHRQRQDSRD